MNVILTQVTSLAPIFAQDAPAAAPAGSGPFSLVMGIFVFLIALFLIFVLPKKSQDKQMRKLLDSIKPNDKVLTYGGVIGIVYSIDKEAGEIVLRVDDSGNVKMRFALSSVYFVYKRDEAQTVENKSSNDKK